MTGLDNRGGVEEGEAKFGWKEQWKGRPADRNYAVWATLQEGRRQGDFCQNGPMTEMAQNTHAMTSSFSGPCFAPIWF